MCVGKKWRFWFCEALAFVCRAKPNVPFVRLAKIVLKKSGSAKKLKHEALGCRVGKKSAIKFICRPDVSIIVCSFNGCCVTFTLAYNVWQLQEVGDFEAQNCLPAVNLIRSTKHHLTTEPPISCGCCYGLVTNNNYLFFIINFTKR